MIETGMFRTYQFFLGITDSAFRTISNYYLIDLNRWNFDRPFSFTIPWRSFKAPCQSLPGELTTYPSIQPVTKYAILLSRIFSFPPEKCSPGPHSSTRLLQLQPPHAENYLTPLPPMTPGQHERKLFNRVSSPPPPSFLVFFPLSLFFFSPRLETNHPLTTLSREIVARASFIEFAN